MLRRMPPEPTSSTLPTFRLGERPRLVLASFLMLFAELALIRWVSAYVVYVAYFTNFVLLASFLGIGVGFLRARSTRDLSRWAPAALGVLALLVFLLPAGVVHATGGTKTVGLNGFVAIPMRFELPMIFLGTVFAMACIAEGVARLFERFEPLDAYRLDILGSLSGIVAFSLLSFLRTGPLVWGLVIGVLFLTLSPRRPDWKRVVSVVLVTGAFGLGALSTLDTWSPYYRVTVGRTSAQDRTEITVNNLPHQTMMPVDQLTVEQPFYAKPYTHLVGNPLDDVLIVGAGNGNDVALALSQGAKHIDAVEIDPVIQAIGAQPAPRRIRIRTRGSPCTSTTAARSWSAPTPSTT